MKKALIIMTFSAMAAGCADNSIPKAQLPELDTTNPLLAEWNTPHQTPPFSQIELSDYEPAFDAAIACSRAEIEAIVNNPKKPTFGNTIVALERQGALLDRISGVFYNLLEAATSDQMQEIALRVQPKLTELSNDVSLNPELFARVKAVYEKPGRGLSKEDRKLLEDTYQSFARNGAALSDADKELYRKYTSELSAATLQFGQNALAATNAFTINITDPKVVAELPAFVREGMAADAKARREGLDRDAAGAELCAVHDLFVEPRPEGEALARLQFACAGRRERQHADREADRQPAPEDRQPAGL